MLTKNISYLAIFLMLFSFGNNFAYPGSSKRANTSADDSTNPPMSLSASVTNVSCTAAHNGAVNLTITGGTAPYVVSWDTVNVMNGPAFAVTFGVKPPTHPYYNTGSSFGYVIDGIPAKSVTITRGITYSFFVSATSSHPFYISSIAAGGNISNLVSSGQAGAPSGNGTVTFTPSNSHPSLLYYACQFHQYMGYNVNIGNGYIAEDLSNLKAGTYSVVVTDATGSTATAQYEVTALPSPVTISGVVTNESCSGHNGAINLTASGGLPPYTVLWDTINISGNSNMFSVMIGSQTPANPYYGMFNYLTYYFDGTESKTLNLARGIPYFFNLFTISHPWYISTDSVGLSLGTMVISGQGGAPNDDGLVTFIPNSCHPPVLYYDCAAHPYMGGKINIYNAYNGEDLTGHMAGIYNVVVTDAAGCTSSATFNIEPPAGGGISPPADITASGLLTFCPGGNVQLTASNGIGFTYLWSNGSTNSSITVFTQGSFTVQVTNSSGCSSVSTPVAVTIYTKPADINKNGITETNDFLLLLGKFNQTCTGCAEDIDHNGIVDTQDFLILLGEFNQVCSY